MVALVFLVCWAVAELLVAIVVAETIGVLVTVVLLIATWPLGTWALRSQGAAAWRRLGAAVQEGRPPAREVVDGALVLLGGVWLIVPGFITDAIAVCLLAPPTRALMRPLLLRNVESKLSAQATGFGRRSSYDVDSTARDIDQPQLRS